MPIGTRARAVAERRRTRLRARSGTLRSRARSPAAPNRRSRHRGDDGALRRRRDPSAITTPLPAARPSAFSTTGKPKSPDRTDAQRVVERLAGAKARGRHAVARHERLRERLARFEPRRGRRRTEEQPACRREAIGDAEAQRQLGPDDGEVDLLAIGERERAPPGRSRSTGSGAARARNPGIAGRADDARRRPGSAASRATSACSRAPLPMTRTLIV